MKICYRALYSLYISKVWGLVYFDSLLLLSPIHQVSNISFIYLSRTKVSAYFTVWYMVSTALGWYL